MTANVPAGYEIGPAHRRELVELPAIEIAAAELFPPEQLAPGLREEGLPLAFFEAAAAVGRLWVARSIEPPAPVGFAAATLLDGSAHLHEIDVLPAHGRRGLGRALVLRVAEWARASASAQLTLTTFRDLPWNAPFYAGLGFVEIPTDEIGPELQASLAQETENGLDASQRVSLRLKLAAT